MHFVGELSVSLRQVFQLAQEALGQTQQQQRERDNRKVQVREFQPGQRVLLKYWQDDRDLFKWLSSRGQLTTGQV